MFGENMVVACPIDPGVSSSAISADIDNETFAFAITSAPANQRRLAAVVVRRAWYQFIGRNIFLPLLHTGEEMKGPIHVPQIGRYPPSVWQERAVPVTPGTIAARRTSLGDHVSLAIKQPAMVRIPQLEPIRCHPPNHPFRWIRPFSRLEPE